VEKILEHQRDILPLKSIEEVETVIRQTNDALQSGMDTASLEKQMNALEQAASKWLRPYPNAAFRENVEVLLVALAVAMGVRTFFLQPFKIPTGSMQPTLFGVTSAHDDGMKIPTGWERVKQWFAGISYIEKQAAVDGELQWVSQPVRFLIFNIKQTFIQGGQSYTIWFPPDYGSATLEQRAGIHVGQTFHKGEDIVKLRISAGDHLFVDRLTYNFRPPKRGEIIVFETRGIDTLPQDQFYIKRLVALSGEHVQVGDDRHLIIDGTRLTAETPHFADVYSFKPEDPPQESHYSGHVNEKVAEEFHPPGQFLSMPLFPNQSATYEVRPDHLMVMGDNTMNSYDSRYWGDFPLHNVIGRAFFVYWPITDRFGWGCLKH
jgi:signal peptidase I